MLVATRVDSASLGVEINMNLSRVERGKTVTIVSVRQVGRALEERLAALGLFPGAKVMVVRASSGGEMILGCLDSRFALGRDLTNAIEVC